MPTRRAVSMPGGADSGDRGLPPAPPQKGALRPFWGGTVACLDPKPLPSCQTVLGETWCRGRSPGKRSAQGLADASRRGVGAKALCSTPLGGSDVNASCVGQPKFFLILDATRSATCHVLRPALCPLARSAAACHIAGQRHTASDAHPPFLLLIRKGLEKD